MLRQVPAGGGLSLLRLLPRCLCSTTSIPPRVGSPDTQAPRRLRPRHPARTRGRLPVPRPAAQQAHGELPSCPPAAPPQQHPSPTTRQAHRPAPLLSCPAACLWGHSGPRPRPIASCGPWTHCPNSRPRISQQFVFRELPFLLNPTAFYLLNIAGCLKKYSFTEIEFTDHKGHTHEAYNSGGFSVFRGCIAITVISPKTEAPSTLVDSAHPQPRARDWPVPPQANGTPPQGASCDWPLSLCSMFRRLCLLAATREGTVSN